MSGIKLTAVVFFALLAGGCEKGGESGTDKPEVTVRKIVLEKQAATLLKGKTMFIPATIMPEDASDKSVSWSSGDTKVAAVDRTTGEITGIGAGKTVITATTNDGNKKATCIVAVTPTLNIFFIGNSFTHDAVQHLPGIVAAAGIDGVKMVFMLYGGRTIEEHSAKYFSSGDADYRCFRYAPGSDKWVEDSQRRNLASVFRSDEWNVVSIQEHTGRSVAWDWTANDKAVIENWIARMRSDQSGDPDFAYIMSQAYGDPDIIGDYGQKNVLVNNFASQADMYEAIAVRARMVVEQTPAKIIMATGTMLQNLRSSAFNTPYDLTRDGYHMDYGLSRYGASCVVYGTLIYPVFGIGLDGNSWRFGESSTDPSGYTTPVSDMNVLVARQSAMYAIESPYGVTLMTR